MEDTPHLVGFSVNFLSQALTAFAMIGFIRSRISNVRIVIGGGLITSWLRHRLQRNPFPELVDKLIDGPGEQRLVALCYRMKSHLKVWCLIIPGFMSRAPICLQPCYSLQRLVRMLLEQVLVLSGTGRKECVLASSCRKTCERYLVPGSGASPRTHSFS